MAYLGHCRVRMAGQQSTGTLTWPEWLMAVHHTGFKACMCTCYAACLGTCAEFLPS